MLNVLENLLAAALPPALPQNLTIAAGPMPPPAPDTLPLVNIAATALRSLAPAGGDAAPVRDPAYHTERISLHADGNDRDFTLPQQAKGDLVEVEWAPGRLARPGDEYWVEQGKLRFYRAPAGDFTVLVRGERAAGYQERFPCRATVEIHSWGKSAKDADDLMPSALAAVLAALAGLDRLELARVEGSGFSFRLMKPMAQLYALERAALPQDTPLYRSSAKLRLDGEWELTVALGAPAPEGLIEDIKGRLQVLDTRKPPAVFE